MATSLVLGEVRELSNVSPELVVIGTGFVPGQLTDVTPGAC